MCAFRDGLGAHGIGSPLWSSRWRKSAPTPTTTAGARMASCGCGWCEGGGIALHCMCAAVCSSVTDGMRPACSPSGRLQESAAAQAQGTADADWAQVRAGSSSSSRNGSADGGHSHGRRIRSAARCGREGRRVEVPLVPQQQAFSERATYLESRGGASSLYVVEEKFEKCFRA